MARMNEVYPARRRESARTPAGNAICAAWQWALLSRSFHRVEPAA